MLVLNLKPFPELETEKLKLRPIVPEDANELYLMRSDERVMKYLDRPKMKSVEEGEAFIQKIINQQESNEGIMWALSLRGEEKMIGNICFWRIEKEHYRAEVGYMMQPDHSGKGMMSEAMRAVLDHGFRKLKFHSVEANVNPANIASIRLLEKNGFVREAYFKENYFYDGKFLDSAIYSLLTPEHGF